MQRTVRIEWDLESTPLEIRTNSVLGNSDRVHVNFYSAGGDEVGRVYLRYHSPVQYYLEWCSPSWTNFPVTEPSANDKVWRITLTRTAGVRLVIHCNDVEVFNRLLSTCTYGAWSTYWSRDVTKIWFDSSDTASDDYKSGD